MRLNQCDCCSGKFGLVLHRLWMRRFCSKPCKKAYQADRTRWVDLRTATEAVTLRFQCQP
jgi:hypothetical protein